MTTWVTRQQWGARASQITRPLSGFKSGWFIHWLGIVAGPDTPDDKVLRDTQRYHMESKGWADIAYSFAVGRQHPDHAYDLRGWGVQGGHTEGHNSQSMAIVFLLGTGELPTDTMLDTARAILAEGVRRGYSADVVRPHNAVRSTACPGPDLTAWVNAGRFTKETTMPYSATQEAAQRMVNAWLPDQVIEPDGRWGDASTAGLKRALTIAENRIDSLEEEAADAVANREAAEAEALDLRRQIQEGSGRASVLTIVQGLRATLNEAEAKLQGLA